MFGLSSHTLARSAYKIISPLDTIYKPCHKTGPSRFLFGTRSYANIARSGKKFGCFPQLYIQCIPPYRTVFCFVFHSQFTSYIRGTCAINTHSSIISRARLRVSIVVIYRCFVDDDDDDGDGDTSSYIVLVYMFVLIFSVFFSSFFFRSIIIMIEHI